MYESLTVAGKQGIYQRKLPEKEDGDFLKEGKSSDFDLKVNKVKGDHLPTISSAARRSETTCSDRITMFTKERKQKHTRAAQIYVHHLIIATPRKIL